LISAPLVAMRRREKPSNIPVSLLLLPVGIAPDRTAAGFASLQRKNKLTLA
jgi:hypothetical protein